MTTASKTPAARATAGTTLLPPANQRNLPTSAHGTPSRVTTKDKKPPSAAAPLRPQRRD